MNRRARFGAASFKYVTVQTNKITHTHTHTNSKRYINTLPICGMCA